MRVDVGERLDGAPDEGKDGRPVKALPDSWAGGQTSPAPMGYDYAQKGVGARGARSNTRHRGLSSPRGKKATWLKNA